MTGPIKPRDVVGQKTIVTPEAVYEAFNELIVENYSGGSATVRQDEVVELILKKIPKVTRDEVFTRGWLNVEEAYRKAGWKVSYDKPGFNETYAATFSFQHR